MVILWPYYGHTMVRENTKSTNQPTDEQSKRDGPYAICIPFFDENLLQYCRRKQNYTRYFALEVLLPLPPTVLTMWAVRVLSDTCVGGYHRRDTPSQQNIILGLDSCYYY